MISFLSTPLMLRLLSCRISYTGLQTRPLRQGSHIPVSRCLIKSPPSRQKCLANVADLMSKGFNTRFDAVKVMGDDDPALVLNSPLS